LQFHFDKHDETSETERQGLVWCRIAINIMKEIS
jgi:hypothetical protein